MKILFFAILSFYLFTSCNKLSIESEVNNQCGINTARLLIDDQIFCTNSRECGVTLKKNLSCGSTKGSDDLNAYFWFSDVSSSSIDYQRFVGIKIIVKRVNKVGRYKLELSGESSSKVVFEDKDVKLSKGEINITNLQENEMSATYTLNVTYEGKEFIATGDLYKIEIDQ